jgi:hypothetical protein
LRERPVGRSKRQLLSEATLNAQRLYMIKIFGYN